MQIRRIKESDYDTLVQWWKDWGWTPPSKDFLPEGGTGGYIVLVDDKPVCAAFMYITNSAVCWLDWVISDKNFREKEKRKEALYHLLRVMEQIADSLDHVKYIYALIKNNSLIEKYKELGFTQADSYNTEMIKKIK